MPREFLFIRECKIGHELCCSVHVKKGDKVFELAGSLLIFPTRESIYIGNDIHVVDDFGTYMNHSFTPNCKIDGFNVIAIKPIIPGDALTFNYNVNEVKMASPFVCDGILVKGKY
jgi:hypothetical protein